MFFVDYRKFKIAREILNLKQIDVASEAGIGLSTYQNIEISKADPKVSTYKTIVEYFEEKGIVFQVDGNVVIKP